MHARPSTFPMDRYLADTELPYGSDNNLIAFIAEEVRRQQDSPWHVFRMYDAWKFAQGQYGNQEWTDQPTLTHGIIRELGRKVDEENYGGYRRGDVYIGGRAKMPPVGIMGAMDRFLKNQHKMTPIDAYAMFEEVHPFYDGNGRVGKIIYCWLKGCLDNPQWPVDLYGGIDNP